MTYLSLPEVKLEVSFITVVTDLVLGRLLSLVLGTVTGGVRLSLVRGATLLLVAGHKELTETRCGEHIQGAVAGLHQLCEPFHGL